MQCCFTGNHILPDEDLAAFHWNLLGSEHPLASLKVFLFIKISLLHVVRYFFRGLGSANLILPLYTVSGVT